MKIVDAVRTIILNWAIKLEEDGIVGEGLAFAHSEREIASKTPYNINNFYGPVHSPQIQQQTSKSYQVSSEQHFDISSVREFLDSLEKQIEALNLTNEVKQELKAEVKTAKAQVDSPRPKHKIIHESLASIRRIIEGAGGGVAAQLLPGLASLLNSFAS